MCGTTIALLIVLIIVVSGLIVTKEDFSNFVQLGRSDVYSKIGNTWNFYPLWTVERGTVIICKLIAESANSKRVVQDKVVVFDKDAQDLDIIDYLRKIASPDFNVDGPGVYSLYVNFVYTPSGQNLDLAYYPVFYLEENYKGIPIPGNVFANPNDPTQFDVPEFIKSCRLNRHARIVVTKSSSKLTLVADSPKLI